MGNPKLRNLLFMCSFNACKYNKTCKALFDRIVAKRKSKKLALIAVCNKLLKQAFSIIKNGLPYSLFNDELSIYAFVKFFVVLVFYSSKITESTIFIYNSIGSYLSLFLQLNNPFSLSSFIQSPIFKLNQCFLL